MFQWHKMNKWLHLSQGWLRPSWQLAPITFCDHADNGKSYPRSQWQYAVYCATINIALNTYDFCTEPLKPGLTHITCKMKYYSGNHVCARVSVCRRQRNCTPRLCNETFKNAPDACSMRLHCQHRALEEAYRWLDWNEQREKSSPNALKHLWLTVYLHPCALF